MTNRQRFFANGIMLAAVGILIRSVSILFNSFITRSVGAEGIGLFTLIMNVYAFAVTFATSGISLTVTRLVSSAIGRGEGCEVRSIMNSAIKYTLIFSGAATLTLFFGAPYFAGRVINDLRCTASFRVLALSLIPLALSSVFSGYFVGVKRVTRNATVQVLAQVFKISITAGLLSFISSLGVEGAIIALCVSITLTEMLVFAVAYIEFLVDKRRTLSGNGGKSSHFHSVSSMALPLAVSAYIRSALLTLEHILIPMRLRAGGHTHSEALSAYGVLHGMALPLILYPMSPLSSFAGLVVPEFSESMAREERDRMERIASESINTTLAYSIAATVLVFIFSEGIGYAVYGSYEAGRYIALIAPVIPIMYLDHVTDSILKGIGEHVYSMWVNISDSALSILLVWLLISRLGISGYAIVIVVMEGYNFLLSVIRLYSKIRFRIMPLRYVFIPFLSATLSAVLSRALFEEITAFTPVVWLVLEILFAVCVFAATYKLTTHLFDMKKKRSLG
jgi:stage V sporulation protein B